MSAALTDFRVRLLNATDPAAVRAEVIAFSGALIVDGLFGIGLSRPLDADWLNLVAALNASRVPILAVDVPSGLDADTGEPLGDGRVTALDPVELADRFLEQGHRPKILLASGIGRRAGLGDQRAGPPEPLVGLGHVV
ncbi:MAG: hypothetical protein EB141_13540, partial [Verrucomicrobia bacterium]|nr:hypothetical protein [Verrucomicrobiota bacterium]